MRMFVILTVSIPAPGGGGEARHSSRGVFEAGAAMTETDLFAAAWDRLPAFVQAASPEVLFYRAVPNLIPAVSGRPAVSADGAT